MSDGLYILGINAYDHDVTACLLKDGEIVAAISKERLTGVKHDTGFYKQVVEYCLDTAGIHFGDISLIVRNCYVSPVEKMEERLMYNDWPLYLNERERGHALVNPLFMLNTGRAMTISHHLAHAYSAFAVSPFEEGAVMVVDGVGSYRTDVTEAVPEADEDHPYSRESESYYRFKGTEIETIKKTFMGPHRGIMNDDFFNMNGLGALYSRVSSYIFHNWNKCGEVMGLAPYGRPGKIPPLLHLGEDGHLEVPEWTKDFQHPFLGNDDEEWETSSHRQEWEDLAWRVQDDAEKVLIARANWLHQVTGVKNLCIAGGVALNCVANGRIVRETPFENVWIQPAAGDDGIAIGCACYGHLALQKQKRSFVMNHAYTGRTYGKEDEDAALKAWWVRGATRKRRRANVIDETAKLLADGKVIGWFQGGSEIGPRALGNRSLLADPREASMKDHVNARVKHRQGFRPFAPAVLAERAQEVFEGEEESPFMLLVKNVRPDWREKVAAIVHVDGTARVQTVRQDQNPKFHALISAFDKLTGVPVVMNTSFNDRGEPIVETPMNAVDTFLATGIDVLVLHDLIIHKSRAYRLFFPIHKLVQKVQRNMSTEAWMMWYERNILTK